MKTADQTIHPATFNQKKILIPTFTIIGVFLFFTAWLHLLGPSIDYANYKELATHPELGTGTEELTYQLALYIGHLINPNSECFLFFVYALIGVPLKLHAIFRESKLPLYTLILYIPTYFLLHEYVQIRESIAVGFFIFSFRDLIRGNIRGYLSKALCATLFHWSAAVMLLVYPLVRHTSRNFLTILPILALFVYALHLGDLNLSHNDSLVGYLILHSGPIARVNVLNILTLLQACLFAVFAFHLHRVSHRDDSDQRFFILFGIYSVSLSLFFFFSSLDLPVVTFRLCEFLNVVIYFLLTDLVIAYKNKRLAFAAIGLFYTVIYSMNLIIFTGIIPLIQNFATHRLF